MINVDVRGVLLGITAVLLIMQEQGCVHIINVASIGAHAVTPTAAVYCASKYAVRATPDGLRRETSVLRVTVVSPGVVESELGDSGYFAGTFWAGTLGFLLVPFHGNTCCAVNPNSAISAWTDSNAVAASALRAAAIC